MHARHAAKSDILASFAQATGICGHPGRYNPAVAENKTACASGCFTIWR
jgi:hypothetical protein